ncbi:putative disease resistance protein [Vitis vinifera]|uniref:Putative disease resistance protein n=1 Tax=Vitis vinifera TaxID=29760 RepID=A0A438IBQ1_VITVI|nr:putative disease resistance protein [Vitis vinifera]
MKSLPIGFFQFMPVIRVLDLSGNKELVELPLEICRLESLEYLNLTWTSIKRMPIELKNLTKLRCLVLNYLERLEVIPSNVISCLPNLKMFSMHHDNNRDIVEYDEVGVLQELGVLAIHELDKYHLTYSPNCSKISHLLDAAEVHTTSKDEDMPRFEGGGAATFGHISNSNFHNLFEVFILGCRFLNLTWLIYAPSLELLSVGDSQEMEEIIGSDECGDSEIEQQNLSVFSRLVKLTLVAVPNLKSIYKWALPFPSLKEIGVIGCPNLRKLPLNSNSATNTLKKIEGHLTWWEELEWENDNLKRTFTPYFKIW